MVVPPSCMGGQTSVTPGKAVTLGVVEFQIPEFTYIVSLDDKPDPEDDVDPVPPADCKLTA